MVEKLHLEENEELLDLFTDVFSTPPFLPGAIETREQTRSFFKSSIDLYKTVRGTVVYGIRMEGRLACAALATPASAHFGFLSTAGFLAATLFETGYHTIQVLNLMQQNKPVKTDGLLELVMIGTSSDFQGRGLAKTILDELYREAKEQCYKGVLLLVQKGTNAHRLYEKQGFEDKSGFTYGDRDNCWMIKSLEAPG